jgi:hypothetical protein
VYHLVIILLNAIFFILDPFLKLFFFQFYSSIFDWLGIEFYDFFPMVSSHSHDSGHEFEMLTQVDIDFFFKFLF